MIGSEPILVLSSPGPVVRLPPGESAVLGEETDDGLRLYPRASLKPIKDHQQDTHKLSVKVRSRTSQGQVRSSQDTSYFN